MKKFLLVAAAALVILSMLGSCSNLQTDEPDVTNPTETPSAGTTSTVPQSGDNAASDAAAYAQQIERYYTAIANQWGEDTYFDNEMSSMVVNYYEGNALDNVGYAFLDLDGDGVRELIIGAVMNAEKDPLVFEIWTLKDGEPTMLAQSNARNRYYLQYAEDSGAWSVAYEAENGAANYAVYYLRLAGGKFEVIQGVVFDATESEAAPWFTTSDLDWDVSNDTPVDEAAANAVMEAGRNIYTHTTYSSYSQYQ